MNERAGPSQEALRESRAETQEDTGNMFRLLVPHGETWAENNVTRWQPLT